MVVTAVAMAAVTLGVATATAMAAVVAVAVAAGAGDDLALVLNQGCVRSCALAPWRCRGQLERRWQTVCQYAAAQVHAASTLPSCQ